MIRRWPKVMSLLTALAFSWLLASGPLLAASLTERQVPEPLRSWVPWVLQDHETISCPAAYGDANHHECVWPARLQLDLNHRGGRFSFDVEVFSSDSVVLLPGQAEAWPQAVRANGSAATMTAIDGRPALRFGIGRYRIEGEFNWSQTPQGMPQSIFLPLNTGLIDARFDGRSLGWPDATGQLWLRKAAAEPASADELTVRVFRRIDDDIPQMATTQLELTVAGKPREVRLPSALLPQFIPLGISSQLPARLQPDGSLRVQLRAGSWTIVVSGRSRAPVSTLALPSGDVKANSKSESKSSSKDEVKGGANLDAAWDEEVWSFGARNELRLVTVVPEAGAIAIDPRQAGVPGSWQSLPAFRMPLGATLRFAERRRGDPEPDADKLTLDRTLWLDFDGGGYTARDAIRGTIARSWRLDTQPGIVLGRAAVSGEEQFITRLPGQKSNGADETGGGIEVRQGNARIDADSRIGDTRQLAVAGWRADFERVGIELRLPPGWRLLHASGADSASNTWVARWTLWDFFFVLLIVAASFRLHGAAAALCLGTALVLTWHIPDAPRWLWLVLLGFSALRVAAAVRQGATAMRFAVVIEWLWRATLAVIVIVLLPFAVREVRQAIYPALEMTAGAARSISSAEGQLAAEQETKPAAAPAPQTVERMKEMKREDEAQDVAASDAVAPLGLSASLRAGRLNSPKLALRTLAKQDPNAKIQTGPGLPNWSWHAYRLAWNGPVERSQMMSLWLQPPWLTRCVTAVMLLLLALAIWLHVRPRGASGGAGTTGDTGASVRTRAAVARWFSRSGAANGSAPLLLAVLLSGALLAMGVFAPVGSAVAAAPPPAAPTSATSPPAIASDWPSQSLLDELRERLRRPAACQPNCALITRLSLRAQSQSLQLRLEVHAGAATFAPLPGGSWRPADVQLDGHAASLRRDSLGDGVLWLRLPAGIHQVTMSSPLAGDTVQIALPLPPRVVTADIAGWTLSGVDARGLATGALTLNRIPAASGRRGNLSGRESEADRQEDNLLPFVRVVRTIQLDRQWTIATQIVRASASQAPITVRVPLLAGEAVTDAGVRVEGGVAIVTVGAGASGGFASVLAVAPMIELRAADEINQIETWRLDVAPMWHAQFSGLAPVTRQEGSRWLPQWQPWPGEKVTIAAVQPEGVAGQTLTIDDVQLSARAGQRSTDVAAILTLRSSQGGNQTIELPEQAELRAVRIDGAPQPIRAEGRRVTLPLVPGARNVALDWRETRGISSIYRSAQADFGAPAVNVRSSITVPADRWVLAVGGPLLGPAVLFWGIALVIAAGAVVLARLRWTPLAALAWFLLGIGVAQATLAGLVVVVAVTLAFQARHRFGARVSGWHFNLMQIVLAVAALFALSILFEAIRTGLLGRPDMLITGNGSSAYQLNWYTDRIDRTPPTAWVISAPLWVYRVLMLAWALWLALVVIRWASWAWTGFASERLWEKVWKRSALSPSQPVPAQPAARSPPEPLTPPSP